MEVRSFRTCIKFNDANVRLQDSQVLQVIFFLVSSLHDGQMVAC